MSWQEQQGSRRCREGGRGVQSRVAGLSALLDMPQAPGGQPAGWAPCPQSCDHGSCLHVPVLGHRGPCSPHVMERASHPFY